MATDERRVEPFQRQHPGAGRSVDGLANPLQAGLELTAQLGTALTQALRFVDLPNGLIDGLDGEAVVTQVVANTLDLISRHRCGLDPDRVAEDAALLAQLFPELKQAMVFVPGHALLGVTLPAGPRDATLSHEGETYLLMEPTGPAQLPIGQLAPASRVLVDSRQLSVQPVLASQ